MPNYKLLIEYDGRTFNGWQKQKLTSNTIQEKIERAIGTLTRTESVILTVAGRTDAGVSALNQVANFRSDERLDNVKFMCSVNSLLPKQITIKDIQETNDYFSARYSATGREYLYRCTNVRRSIDCDFYYHVRHVIDLEKMFGFMEFVRELKCFRSFCKNKEDKRNFECNIRSFLLELKPECNELMFTISADRFLHSMIRALIGCALDVSRGRFDLDEVMSRAANGQRFNVFYLPAKPLILNKIFYSNE